ncbi:hypothetical protein Tsubulata_033559, partial [Turnera subulata]
KVRDLMADKRRLVEVPYTASLAHTMNALVANNVDWGRWVHDLGTGVVRKHYIGMATMLDILVHIAGDDHMPGGGGGGGGVSDLDKKMSVPVSSVIGHCLEGLSLWTLSPSKSILDCMEVFSKGIHRALVPVDGQMDNVSGPELMESASSYRMLTQMDLVKFLKHHASDHPLKGILSRSVRDLGAANENVFAIGSRTRVIDAIRCMREGLLNAVPIGKGKKLIGTFSATDLRGCHLSALETWLPLSALEFTEAVSSFPLFADVPGALNTSSRELVTCYLESPLGEVLDKAVTKHVYRVWVVDHQCFLVGLVSLTDMVR